MKSHCLFLILLVCGILVGCQEKRNTISITGELENVEEHTVITLYESKERSFETLLSDTVINGKFTFTLPDSILKTTKQLAIMSNAKGFPPTWLCLWISPGDEVKITGKDKLIRTWDVKSNNPLQKELNVYNDRIKAYQRGTQIAMTQAYACFDSMRIAPDRHQIFKAQIDSLYAINDSLNYLLSNAEIELLGEQKTFSDVWMDKLNYHAMQLRYAAVAEEKIAKLQALYDAMPEEKKKTDLGESVYLSLNQPKVVGVGDDMADMDMWDLEGNTHRLEQYKGKYILLDFWSSGCGPCIKSIPEMREIFEQYKDKLTIVSISSDPQNTWTETSKEKNITWVNLNDFKGDNGIKLHYGVKGIPNYFMISPEGKIIDTWMGYGEGSLKKKIKEFF